MILKQHSVCELYAGNEAELTNIYLEMVLIFTL